MSTILSESAGPDSRPFHFAEVPPPQKAPVNQIGETLGLCAGLRPERRRDQFRCASCSKMQPAGAWLVWVPDSVRKGDPAWSVEEAARTNAYNGSNSGWCMSCAPKAAPRKRTLPAHRVPNCLGDCAQGDGKCPTPALCGLIQYLEADPDQPQGLTPAENTRVWLIICGAALLLYGVAAYAFGWPPFAA